MFLQRELRVKGLGTHPKIASSPNSWAGVIWDNWEIGKLGSHHMFPSPDFPCNSEPYGLYLVSTKAVST